MSYGYDIAFGIVYVFNGTYYKTWDGALIAYKAATSQTEIKRVPTIIVDDVYYLGEPITLVDDVRARALNKLTEEERAALGVK